MIFKQIRSVDGTGTLSYLIADSDTLNGIMIDPNIEDIENIKKYISDSKIKLKYVIDTHTHADHISAAGELKKLYDSRLIMHENTKDKWKVVDEGDKFGIGDILRANASLEPDLYINGNEVIDLDSLKIKFMFTPGHTDNHISVLLEDKLFTGDLLLIGQAGRSDLPGGNSEDQYESLFTGIIPLPGKTKIYPGHDYEDNEYAMLSDELNINPFLKNRTKEEYINFVKDFFPPITDITEQGKAILQCGTKRVSKERTERFRDINAAELTDLISKDKNIFLLDVREPFELLAFGAVPGVVNIPMGSVVSRINDLPKDKKIVVICQTGNRSYEIAHYLAAHGFSEVYNLEGGTSSWMYKKPGAGHSNSIRT